MSAPATARRDDPSGRGLGEASLPGWIERLFVPLPIGPLVYFRVAFGAILLWEIARYFASGWIRSHYLTGRFAFKYYGFEWVQAWPREWLYVHFAVTGLAAAGILLGAAYRLSAIVFFAGFTYVFLLDQLYYLNHLYLVCLLAFLLMFVPAHRAFSVDARLRPGLRASHVPAWTLHLLRFQVGIVYVFGGIAKLNADWLRGEPIRTWLRNRPEMSVLDLALKTEPAVRVICYGGLLLDLLIVPLLLWRRTRWPAAAALVVFHLSNAALFQIGIFPWFMLATTPLFFPPEWWNRPGGSGVRPVDAAAEPPTAARERSHAAHDAPGGSHRRAMVAGCLGAYVLIQVLVPLRHFLYPGVVHWTEEGHRFSWHMKLRAKRVQSAEFRASDPDAQLSWEVPTEPYLPRRHLMRAAGRPDMVQQLARAISQDLRAQGHPHVEVRVSVIAALNDHPPQELIDPEVDLGRTPRSLRPAGWIVPLAPCEHAEAEFEPPEEDELDSPEE